MKRRNTKGAFLIEAMFAMAIFALVTLGYISSLTASSRASAVVPYEIMAENLASRIIERMQLRTKMGGIEEYDKLGDPNAAPEDSFMETFTFESDPENTEGGLTFNVDVAFRGFGMVSQATNDTLEAVFPGGFEPWGTNEWQGNPVMIKKGHGSGQIAYILSNSEDTLTITRNLDGTPGRSWISKPRQSSYFEINGGKTATVTVSWEFRGKPYTKEYQVLIYHP